MDSIRLAENLLTLRKDKKITQEQLADFCGVTKASVSKWETGQTLPDILLLPRLAAFFGVSIDVLMGYKMHLTTEQIHKVYEELAMDFATKKFEESMKKSREYVKQYYSCYEFLEKIILLWISHEILAGDKRDELLREAKGLCDHILKNCRDISVCNDIVFLQAIIDLLLGHPEDVVDVLEELCNPFRLSVQSEEVLLSAYIEMGLREKGNDFAQISIYFHVLYLISDACRFLVIHRDDLEKCEETKRRVEALIVLYNFAEINFYYVALFAYQMAEIYCYHGETGKALEQLTKYVELYERYLSGKTGYMQSDNYLDRLHSWCEKSILSGHFPREKRTICTGLLAELTAPVFEKLKGEDAYLALQKKAKDMEKYISD